LKPGESALPASRRFHAHHQALGWHHAVRHRRLPSGRRPAPVLLYAGDGDRLIALLDPRDLDYFAFGGSEPVKKPDLIAEAATLYREVRLMGYEIPTARAFAGGFLLAQIGREKWSNGGAAELARRCRE